MNVIEYNKPFEFIWEGIRMQARVQTVFVKRACDEPMRLALECVVMPYIDDKSNNIYNGSKGGLMYSEGELNCITNTPDKYSSRVCSTTLVEYTTFNNKEDDMSITKKYVNKNRDKKLQKAIDNGLIKEDGVLTPEGINLLSQILFEDEEIKKKFLDAVEEFAEDKK